MKKLICIALLLATTTLRAQTQDHIERARELLDSLREGKFESATKEFNPRMAAALPPSVLAQTWAAIHAQVGDVKSELGQQVATSRGITTVTIGVQFERAALDMAVSFGTEKRIAGLQFLPRAQEPLAASLPAGLTEEPFTVGSVPFALPGTLTLPPGSAKVPAVVLVHGSGPGDRDETIGPNKPFRDLAWGLASRGIAVLRYEKRTKQHAAVMARDSSITVREETIEDAVLAEKALKLHSRVDAGKVFVVGHSLGGMLAPRIGQEDKVIAGLVLLAGNVRPLPELIIEQSEYLASLGPAPAGQQAGITALKAQAVRTMDPALPADTPARELMGVPAPYWKDLNAYKPAAAAATLTMPMLILQGERDYQVTMKDFDLWKEALSSKPNVTLKSYPDLNHLFIAGEGKSTPVEYDKPGKVSEAGIKDIADWILRLSLSPADSH